MVLVEVCEAIVEEDIAPEVVSELDVDLALAWTAV